MTYTIKDEKGNMICSIENSDPIFDWDNKKQYNYYNSLIDYYSRPSYEEEMKIRSSKMFKKCLNYFMEDFQKEITNQRNYIKNKLKNKLKSDEYKILPNEYMKKYKDSLKVIVGLELVGVLKHYKNKSEIILSDDDIFQICDEDRICFEIVFYNKSKESIAQVMKYIDELYKNNNKFKIKHKCYEIDFEGNPHLRFSLYIKNLSFNDENSSQSIDSSISKESLSAIIKYLLKYFNKYKILSKKLETDLKSRFKTKFYIESISYLEQYIHSDEFIKNTEKYLLKLKSKNKNVFMLDNKSIVSFLYNPNEGISITNVYGYDIDFEGNDEYDKEGNPLIDIKDRLDDFFKKEFSSGDFIFHPIEQYDREYHLILIPREKLAIKI